MIDTIHLTTGNFEVGFMPNLDVQGGIINQLTGEVKEGLLYADSRGREVIGSKAYQNTDKLNITINLFQGKSYLHTNFSIPKQLDDNNYNELTYGQFNESIDLANERLADLGITANLETANISRIDLFKNVYPDSEVEKYSPIFQLLEAKHTRNKIAFGLEGWLYKNKSQQYCIYDKLKEMRTRKKSIAGLDKTLRFEHRCMKHRKVTDFYKFASLKELKKKGWDSLYQKRIDTWRNGFFKYEVDEFMAMREARLYQDFVNGIRYFQAIYVHQPELKFLFSYLLDKIFYTEDYQVYLEAMKKTMPKSSYYRNKNEFAKRVMEAKQARFCGDFISLGSLYSELREKVLA